MKQSFVVPLLALTFVLAACGGGSTTPPTPTPTPSPTPTPMPTPSPLGSAQGCITFPDRETFKNGCNRKVNVTYCFTTTFKDHSFECSDPPYFYKSLTSVSAYSTADTLYRIGSEAWRLSEPDTDLNVQIFIATCFDPEYPDVTKDERKVGAYVCD